MNAPQVPCQHGKKWAPSFWARSVNLKQLVRPDLPRGIVVLGSFFHEVPKGQAILAGPFKARKCQATENCLMRPEGTPSFRRTPESRLDPGFRRGDGFAPSLQDGQRVFVCDRSPGDEETVSESRKWWKLRRGFRPPLVPVGALLDAPRILRCTQASSGTNSLSRLCLFQLHQPFAHDLFETLGIPESPADDIYC